MVTTFSSRLFGPRGFDLPFVDQLWAGSGVALDLDRQLMRPHFEAPTMCDLQFSEMPGYKGDLRDPTRQGWTHENINMDLM